MARIEIEVDDTTLKPITYKEIEETDQLTPKQEAFCRYYTSGDLTFSVAYLSFALAYGYNLDEASKEPKIDTETGKEIKKSSDWDRMYNTCCVSSSRLLSSAKIQRRITVLLNEGLTEENVDAELHKVIKQSFRLDAKVNAIKEFNALKGRIIKKQDLTSGGERIVVLPQEILAKHGLSGNSQDHTDTKKSDVQ